MWRSWCYTVAFRSQVILVAKDGRVPAAFNSTWIKCIRFVPTNKKSTLTRRQTFLHVSVPRVYANYCWTQKFSVRNYVHSQPNPCLRWHELLQRLVLCQPAELNAAGTWPSSYGVLARSQQRFAVLLAAGGYDRMSYWYFAVCFEIGGKKNKLLTYRSSSERISNWVFILWQNNTVTVVMKYAAI